MNSQEVILVIGAAGGTISLSDLLNSDGTSRFMRENNESFHADLLSEEDREGLCFQSCDSSVGTFSEALNLLKQYSWHQLYPVTVHPEFRQLVFHAVIKLNKKDGEKNTHHYEWEMVCGMPLD